MNGLPKSGPRLSAEKRYVGPILSGETLLPPSSPPPGWQRERLDFFGFQVIVDRVPLQPLRFSTRQFAEEARQRILDAPDAQAVDDLEAWVPMIEEANQEALERAHSRTWLVFQAENGGDLQRIDVSGKAPELIEEITRGVGAKIEQAGIVFESFLVTETYGRELSRTRLGGSGREPDSDVTPGDESSPGPRI